MLSFFDKEKKHIFFRKFILWRHCCITSMTLWYQEILSALNGNPNITNHVIIMFFNNDFRRQKKNEDRKKTRPYLFDSIKILLITVVVTSSIRYQSYVHKKIVSVTNVIKSIALIKIIKILNVLYLIINY